MPAPAQINWPEALARVFADPSLVHPVFQPIVDLKRGMACGYELFARFSGPPNEPPEAWFSAAAELGQGGELDAVVIRKGLALRDALPANCFLTLNVSPRSLLSRQVQDALRAARPLAGVVLEITEQTAVDDYEVLAAALEALRAAGVRVAVNDAGSAYASLGQIIALRPEFVKVDRAFIADLDRDEAKAAVVQMLGEFASRIDAWVVAEGVERREELDALIRLRVPMSQGYCSGARSRRWPRSSTTSAATCGRAPTRGCRTRAWECSSSPHRSYATRMAARFSAASPSTCRPTSSRSSTRGVAQSPWLPARAFARPMACMPR